MSQTVNPGAPYTSFLLYSIDTEYRFDTHDPDMQNAGASRPGIFA